MHDPALTFSPVTQIQFELICALAERETGLEITGNSGTAAHGSYEVTWSYAGNALTLQCVKRPAFLEACVRKQLTGMVREVCGPGTRRLANAKALARGVKQLHPYFKARSSAAKPIVGPWAVPALLQAYGWPAKLPGTGPPGRSPGEAGVIAIVELGGGWIQSDIDHFFNSIDQASPSITDVSVDGTANAPGGDADMEVALDIEIAAAAYYAATGRAATVKVYWAQDIAPAVAQAAKDGCDVCSISWGADEADWGAEAAQEMEAAAAAATAAGMVIFAASGDNDSSDGGSAPANVDCPASCPHIVACGGTNKTASSETVWNDTAGSTNGDGTGGGYSTMFPSQAWQLNAPVAPAGDQYGTGRMVPDVAADADPDTGYEIFVGGQQETVGGTSAVAPLYAGLFAALGIKLGFVTPKLWSNPLAFNDITEGDNGYFKATPGPDPCTGLGSPKAASLAALFEAAPAAPADQEG